MSQLDDLKLFIDEKCEVGPQKRVSSSELHNAYKVWCFRKCRPLNIRQFWRAMEELGYYYRKTSKDRGFDGVALKSDDNAAYA